MTQQIINVGAVANDGTGESLRSAFQAVNDNFSNVWAQGPVDSQVVISNNVISTNVTNQNLVLRPDGIGVITVASSIVPSIDSVWDLGAANAQYDSVYARYYYGDASNMTGLPQPTDLGAVNTDILPIATQAFNIGSQTQQWQKIYTGGIIAGNTSIITINVGNLHIPGGTNGYVLQTDGTGNLSWTAQTGGSGNGTPGGSNTQIQFNDAGAFGGQADFTFNKVSNVITVPGNIVPNNNSAQSLGNATHQWKDLWVSNSSIYMNSVPLTLNSGNVLSIGGNPLVSVNANNVANVGNFVFNGNRLENGNGGSFDNGSLVTGSTSGLGLPANGNTSPTLLYNIYGNVVLQAGANSDVTAQWNFNNNGTLVTQGNISANAVTLSGELIFANGMGAVGEVGYDFAGPAINAYTGKSVNIRSNDQAYSWNFGNAGNLTLPDGSVINDGGLYGNGTGVLGNRSGDNKVYAQASGVGIQTNNGNINNTWFYDRNGNLTLPGNTFAVNYANGTPVNIGGGGSANTGNVTFSDQIVIGTGDIYGGGGLYLAQGPDSVANLQYFRVRGGDVDTHIHFDTGNNQYYDQYFGDDAKYVKLANTGNVLIGTNDYAGNSAQWTFGTDGNTYLPGNILGSGNLKIVPDSANNPYAYLDVYLTSGPDIHVASNGENLILGGDSGANITIGVNGNVDVQTWNGSANTWTFGSDGVLTGPGVSGNITGANVVEANTFVTPGVTIDAMGQITGSPATGVSILANGVSGGFLVDYYGNAQSDANTALGEMSINGGGNVEFTVTLSSNIANGAASRTWRYNTAGGTIFPTLTVNLHNGGNTSGQTLQFGDPSQQAFISGPAPASAGASAERLIIQGHVATGSGEGGDVYVWGGDSQVNGGDIKIYAGDADSGSSGVGGNIHITGGVGYDTGGEISLTGGQTGNGVGAPVYVTGGQGSTTGGNVSLHGGYGAQNGGPVDITGGIGGNGLGSYGNINLHAGASTWTFDNTGNLQVPPAGYITTPLATSGAAGYSVNINAGAADQTDYYTTPGGNVNIAGGLGASNDGGGGGPGGSINISAGNSADPAGHAGNITISSGADTWIFDYTGNLTTPSGSGDIIGANIVSANTFVSNAFNVVTAGNLSITSQYGLGTTGTILEDNGYLEVYGTGNGAAIVGWTASYSNLGDVATVNFNTVASPGNVLVTTGNSAGTTYDWVFDNNGNLQLPGGYSSLGISASGYLTTLTNDSSNIAIDGDNGIVTIAVGGGSATYTFVDSFNATSAANVLNLVTRNGDANPNHTKAQVTMGYNGTTNYPQFIHTIHNAGTSAHNTIDFYTSDGTQAGTFPGNAILGGSITQGAMQLAVYADATARDAVITSPQPGMMVYLTDTGMQVRGATTWNTIAGSGN
jgi:hypothetical protein